VSLVVKLLKMMNRKLWALDLSKSKQAEQIRAERLRNQRSSNGNESFSGKNVGFLRPKFWELARIAKTIPHVAVEEGWGSILFKGWLLTSRLWCRTLTLSLPQSFPSHHLIPPPRTSTSTLDTLSVYDAWRVWSELVSMGSTRSITMFTSYIGQPFSCLFPLLLLLEYSFCSLFYYLQSLFLSVCCYAEDAGVVPQPLQVNPVWVMKSHQCDPANDSLSPI
jgi:hypothetical protein